MKQSDFIVEEFDLDDLDDYDEYDENSPYFDPYADCFDDEPNDLLGAEDDEEYWLQECGLVEGKGCLKAGSEECDFECPFSMEVLQPFYCESMTEWSPTRIFAPVRNWWSDVRFQWRHCTEEYQEHAHWLRYAWGLEDEKYCPF